MTGVGTSLQTRIDESGGIMKKALPVLSLGLFALTGCGGRDQAALTIGPIQISGSELEEEFDRSRYVYMGEAGRKMFLEQYVDTKLILIEADRMGLSRDQEFLKDIQHFWEQALLKRVIEEKSKEYANEVQVSEQEINKYYDDHKQTDFQGKEFKDVHEQVKWILAKIKQSQALTSWTEMLRKKTSITVNEALLGTKE